MASVLSSLIQNIAEYFLGESVESLGGLAHNKPVRGVLFAIMLVIAVWVALASALLWTSQRVPGVMGLWQYTQSSGPAWLLATPIVAGLVVVSLFLPGGGKFSLVALFSVATFGLVLGSLAYFQGGGQYQLNTAAVSSGIAAILLPILALVLAMGDVPPLEAPLARFSMIYWSRFKHLRTLRAWGAQRGFHVKGPEGPKGTLTLEGLYDPSHPLTVTSSVTLKLSSESTASYALSIKEGSPYDITAFRISYQPLPQKLRGRVAAGECPAPHKRTIHFYIVPAAGQIIPQAFVDYMAQVVAAGRPYLGKSDFVHATPFGLRYTHLSYRGLSARDAQMEPVLQWMRQLIGVMEQVSPRPTAGAPGASQQSASPFASR